MNHPLLAEARACLEADPDKAHALCVEMLRQDPDYPQALFLAGVIQLRAERQGTAIPLLEKCARLRP
jgi:cytochrome c-type biogenesis protein CcmH/NrfG